MRRFIYILVIIYITSIKIVLHANDNNITYFNDTCIIATFNMANMPAHTSNDGIIPIPYTDFLFYPLQFPYVTKYDTAASFIDNIISNGFYFNIDIMYDYNFFLLDTSDHFSFMIPYASPYISQIKEYGIDGITPKQEMKKQQDFGFYRIMKQTQLIDSCNNCTSYKSKAKIKCFEFYFDRKKYNDKAFSSQICLAFYKVVIHYQKIGSGWIALPNTKKDIRGRLRTDRQFIGIPVQYMWIKEMTVIENIEPPKKLIY